MRFSERYGYRPIRDALQRESMDVPLRNGLWSLLCSFCWKHAQKLNRQPWGYHLSDPNNRRLKALCNALWFDLFRKPIDELSDDWLKVRAELKRHFFVCEWYDVYDFIEFVATNHEPIRNDDAFMNACNRLLETEMSAYRFVDRVIARITDEQEIAAIEQATEKSEGPVGRHLRRALELLSDRKAPDYRNSVKESISAVESLVAGCLDTDKGTLGALLKKLEDDIHLHPALKDAFIKLYGYTSDEGGIRHALIDDAERVDFHDAKFMLVACSAFVNYLEGKKQN
jgi:hypothetical protein